MKKTLLIVAAALLASMPALAQNKVSVNKDAILSKFDKAKAAVDDAKKASKFKSWITYADALYNAETAYTGNIFDGMDVSTAKLMFGNGQEQGAVTLPGGEFTKLAFKDFTAFVSEGQVKGWEMNGDIVPGAMDKAIEAYKKAYELGGQAAKSKVSEGLKNISNTLLKYANCEYNLGNWKKAGDYFVKAYEVSLLPYAEIDTDYISAYSAGLAYIYSEDFQESYDNLKIALDGNVEQDGDVYYIMYHAWKGLCKGDKEKLAQYENTLTAGLTKYPNNTKIIECMTDLYVELARDPATVVNIVNEAITKDPNNSALWNGLGRLYDQLGDTDKAIDAFKHVAEIEPNDYVGYWSLGILYIRKGDKAVDELNKSTFNGQAEYDAALKSSMDLYYQALEPLEKAHALNPDEMPILEYLKNLCFRLRDYKDGIMDKYNKYNEEFKSKQ